MTHKIQPTWDFAEELSPCGQPNLAELATGGFMDRPVQLPERLLISRVKLRPYFLIIWEPLLIDLPDPKIVQPYCCLVSKVIFYHKPYTQQPGTNTFIEYGRIDLYLKIDDILTMHGERWKVGTGRVELVDDKWWFRCWARKINRN